MPRLSLPQRIAFLGILFLLGTVILALGAPGARTEATAPGIDVYCPTGESCPESGVEPFVLIGLKHSENPVRFEYWPGQVPCDTNTDPPFPCPAGGSPGVPDSAIEQGITEWSAVPSAVDTTYHRLTASPGDSVCGGVFGGLDTLRRGTDGRNSVMWAPLEGSVIGLACWWSGTNECDIILDNTWSGAIDPENVRTVLLHESGHCMGLSHTTVAGAVMRASFSGPQHLHPDDIAGYCAVYGCTVSSPPPTATSTATATSTPTLTPGPAPAMCGKRAWPAAIPVCRFVPGVARD